MKEPEKEAGKGSLWISKVESILRRPTMYNVAGMLKFMKKFSFSTWLRTSS